MLKSYHNLYYKGGPEAMKFFSKEKSNISSPTQDNAPVFSLVNEENASASAEVGNAATASHIPMAVLAKTLGIGASVGNIAADFFLRGGSLTEEESDFWNILNEKCTAILKQINAVAEAPENSETAAAATPLVLDMHLETQISHDQMTAFGCIFPPVGGGKRLSFEELKTEIKNAGIVFGINDSLLMELTESGTVLMIFALAQGKPVRDGVDGNVIELYPREKKISFEANENNMVDYKNLNWLQTIHGGDPICTIVPPIPGEDGVNIRGVVQKAREAKTPKVLGGINTAENEEHTALIASCDGQLVFSGGTFKVEQMIKIDADVDNSIGNLDVIGSITVYGNVFDGFTLKATGDIIVKGTIEGATLIAGGNIQIFQGINGSYKGRLEAGNNVTSRYLENCHVKAGGTVKSDSILNSTVISSDKVVVISGKGIIIGSAIVAFKGVEAKIIGNEQNILASITIGTDPKLYEELRTLRTEVYDLTRKAEGNEKNIQYLLSQESLDAEYQQLLNKLKLDQTIYNLNLSKKSNRISAIEAELKSGESCQIVVNQLNPPVKVTIENAQLTISNEARMCRIFKSEGEIIVGSK